MKPLVTVGLVVYNGEEFIAAAIQSVLNQSYADFRLDIYDNASTDSTPAIISEFSQRDSRITFTRHKSNIGAAANFIMAAERATTPYFCWAAHDDLRAPAFLQTLVEALNNEPSADLACCGVEYIDMCDVARRPCSVTAACNDLHNPSPAHRLIEFYKHSPCTLIYGVFRTNTLKPALEMLRTQSQYRTPPFASDLLFLARFIRDHRVIKRPETLLLLRDGGISHQASLFTNLVTVIRSLVSFAIELWHITVQRCTLRERIQLHIARCRLLLRIVFSGGVRRLLLHHCCLAIPFVSTLKTFIELRTSAFRRLRKRASALQSHSRVVMFGAGKHTQRKIQAFRRALRPAATIVAVADDRAARLQPISNMPLVNSADIHNLRPDIILVSSDTYEDELYRRALQIAGAGVEVWRIYGQELALPQNPTTETPFSPQRGVTLQTH